MSDTNGSLFDDILSSEELSKKLRCDYIKKYNEENRDRINARRRAKRASRPEEDAAIVRAKNAEYANKRYHENEEARLKNKECCKKYREAHLEEQKEKQKIYVKNRKANFSEDELRAFNERQAAASRLYRERGGDEVKEMGRQSWSNYYKENRQEMISRVSEYRANNQESVREYRRKYAKENPDIICSYRRTRRARKAGAGGTHTPEDINSLRVLQKDKCALCLTSIKKHRHIDHIIPISRGGSNDKYNLQLLCAPCNQRKHAKDPIEFNQSLGLLL